PCAMQVPRAADRTYHVVAALHDHRRDAVQAMRIAQQLVVVIEEAAIDEVMVLDPGERQREFVAGAGGHVAVVLEQEARRSFPHRPRARAASRTSGSPDVRRLWYAMIRSSCSASG